MEPTGQQMRDTILILLFVISILILSLVLMNTDRIRHIEKTQEQNIAKIQKELSNAQSNRP